MKKLWIATFIVAFTFISLNAQKGTAFHIGFLNSFGTPGLRGIGFGGPFMRCIGPKFQITAEASMYFGKSSTMDSLFPLNSYGPSPSTVPVSRFFIAYHFGLGCRYYVYGDFEADQGVYLTAEIGSLHYHLTTTKVSSYDNSQYSIANADEAGNGFGASSIAALFGAGYEKNMGHFYWFTNLFYINPFNINDTNNSDGKPYGVTFGSAISIQAGLRFPL